MANHRITAKLRQKFNVSVLETDAQDVHQTIVLSVAAIAADTAMGDSILDNVLRSLARTKTCIDVIWHS